MKRQLVKGSTDVTVYIFIQDSSSTTGAGLTGLVWNSASLVASQVRPLAARVAITLATQTVTGAHAEGGFVEVDATNMPGMYRLDLTDAVCVTGVDSAIVMLKGATNMAPLVLEIQLTTFDMNTDTIGTCTTNTDMVGTDSAALASVCTEGRLAELDGANLPTVTDGIQTDLANATDGLGALKAVMDTSGVVLGDVATHGGTSAVLTLERIIAASTTATEPAVKLTGNTSGAGMLLAGGTTGAGLSCVGGGTSGDGIECSVTSGAEIDADITGDITGNLSGSAGSVTGAVGSVTGAVGSVTGAVGSVAGNVDGNVTGSVGSLGATAKTDVNAEVVDVMDTDTITLPGQLAPPLAPTHREAISHLYKAYRNRKFQNATEWRLYADNETTIDQKAAVSDDGTDAIKQEIVSGL